MILTCILRSVIQDSKTSDSSGNNQKSYNIFIRFQYPTRNQSGILRLRESRGNWRLSDDEQEDEVRQVQSSGKKRKTAAQVVS